MRQFKHNNSLEKKWKRQIISWEQTEALLANYSVAVLCASPDINGWRLFIPTHYAHQLMGLVTSKQVSGVTVVHNNAHLTVLDLDVPVDVLEWLELNFRSFK